MIKVERSSNINVKKTIKEIKVRQVNKTVEYSSQSLLGNDILVSLSGQAKIGHLNSCLELDKQDFIVF